jgi:hypothetical protein
MAPGVPVNVTVTHEPIQTVVGPEIVAVGNGLTVNVAVLTGVAEQPVAGLVSVPRAMVVVVVGQIVNVATPVGDNVNGLAPPGVSI